MIIGFCVNFDVDYDLDIGDETIGFEGSVEIVAHSTDDWELENVSGRVIADGDYIPLVGKPELAWAVRHFLSKNKTFQSRAAYQIGEEIAERRFRHR